jgi:hypothetical protein
MMTCPSRIAIESLFRKSRFVLQLLLEVLFTLTGVNNRRKQMKLFQSIMLTVSMRSVLSFVPSVVKATSGRSGTPKPTTTASLQQRNLFNQFFSSSTANSKYPIMADESVMSKKKHGTSDEPVQKDLRWKCDYDTADRIWYVLYT